MRGVPWSVRCGYLRSFDFGSYYQSTPRAAAVRVQLDRVVAVHVCGALLACGVWGKPE